MIRKILTILLFCLPVSLMWAEGEQDDQNEGGQGQTTTPTQTIINIGGKVFGGARQADIGGKATVNICAKEHDVIINAVYGGNDIAGTISGSKKEGVDYDAFVNITDDGIRNVNNHKHLFIGQLFGGGYGSYTYSNMTTDENGNVTYDVTYTVKAWDKDQKKFIDVNNKVTSVTKPDLGKVSINIEGGTIAYVYGGGDNVTVTEKTNIRINNESQVVISSDFGTPSLLNADRLEKMGITALSEVIDRRDYHFSRVFGGSNKAEMAILPTWDLQRGKIENLYSGGNEGAMTSPVGLLLDINPQCNNDQLSDEQKEKEKQKLEIYNVYGGCRKADVHPKDANGNTVTATKAGLNEALGITDPTKQYKFPDEFSARLIVRGGKITNVYGGNDITGRVYGGNAVGVYTSVLGDVYGGGNGSYPYTDNAELAKTLKYRDYYYAPGESSVTALNEFRPNAEQVSLRVVGTSEAKPTIIHGGIYVGGNSATLKNTTKTKPIAELKIGSYVLADNVFLGNNGANMVKNTTADDILQIMAGKAKDDDGNVIQTKDEQGHDVDMPFSTIELTNADTFAQYMDGCALNLMPSVAFDDLNNGDPATYIDYTSYFGSFFCGGNVGSMTKADATVMNFNRKVVIFDKVVGGCNNAYVPAKENINAEFNGGIIGTVAERLDDGYIQNDTIKNRLILNFNGLKLQPKRWRTTEPEPSEYPKQLVWNTVDGNGNPTNPVTSMDTNDPNYDSENETIRSTDADMERRFKEGHIYGGCYTSGVVNGNVVINLNNSIVDCDILFDEVAEDELGEAILYGHEEGYTITKRNTGVILGQQGMDVLGAALNVFGGGKGAGTEIWGSTTINLNAGYTFQIFGGSEQGVIGRPTSTRGGNDYTFKYTPEGGTEITKTYNYDPRYSCYVNLAGTIAGVSKREYNLPAMAECEFMYGGGFEGPICGNTYINLGKGRIFNSFAGSCNADILGHTETYIGRQVKDAFKHRLNQNTVDNESSYDAGFPWIRDIIYGGNDLGGRIMGEVSFKNRVRKSSTNDTFSVINKVHGYNSTTGDADVLNASAYVEYLQGRADGIFGGCYGTYDYTEDRFVNRGYTYPNGWAKAGFYKPYLNNAFVNFRPTYYNLNNVVKKVYGAGQGNSGESARDSLQNRSYVLIDIPQTEQLNKYSKMEVFGAGAWGGVGMGVTLEGDNPDKDKASAIIDLIRGDIGAAYGASYKEGVTRRTVVNVPVGSTIKIGSIFGGAYGTETLLPCDVYESNVEYHSGDACLIYDPVRTEKETNPDTGEETTKNVGDERMKGAIYGGNNQERRTIYSKINIDVPVKQKHYQYGMTHGTVYGAGCGENTWAEYTEVKLDSNTVRKTAAHVYEVYGGGERGRVLNAESVQKYMNDYWSYQGATSVTDPKWIAAWKLGGGLDPTSFTTYVSNTKTNLSNPLVRTAEIDNRTTKTYKYNTNVIIGEGAKVLNYAYGGGLGKAGVDGSGDVYGTTYIALLGGEVEKDVYAAGTRGAVYDFFGANFTASTTAYVPGGTCRNVYGGGWQGDVGYTHMEISEDKKSATLDNERPGETHVVIGIRPDQTETNLVNDLKKVMGNNATKNDYGYLHGVPAIQRNAYSGGEGGAVFGTANLILNNGYIGYGYHKDSLRTDLGLPAGYYEMIEDKTYKVNDVFVSNDRLKDCGNLFGGGYDVRSSVDFTNVTIWNGVIRNSVHGGGEIATIGRGAVEPSGPSNSVREFLGIYKAGKTMVEMYNGHVMRNVFAGGKGYNIWGYGQQGTLYTDGYVFGQTEVHIHGGEIGTKEGVAKDYGNVFGGGDIGFVWSKGYNDPKSRNTSTNSPGHTYYYYGDNLIEDCKVVIAPELQVKTAGRIGNNDYEQYAYVTTDDLNLLPKKDANGNWSGGWEKLYTEDEKGNDRGITIHNGVFGGGNVSSNSDTHYANSVTVFGNTTATLYDVYHRDFITVGTEHTGGLYGGGNLSLVDGYRELNITNYGTDYYGLDTRIDLDTYRSLSNRERAYFQLEYVCTGNSDTNSQGKHGVYIGGEFYEEGQHLSEENYLKLVEANPNINVAQYWEPFGFCSIYAGRLLNTIQRADFCGVYGSRMVLQGAKDRVADVGEKIDYTINRVGEVSLNKKRSVISTDTGDDYEHGNYFGIYSIVNYLGNLTSDVHFNDPYVAPNGTASTDGKTFYSHKKANYTKLDRNKGISINQVALASGVFLELTTENSTAETKDYGLVTGVVGLDLINVKTAKEGGGFVYAKNEHRVPLYYRNKKNVLLSEYNKEKIVNGVELRDEARTYKRYRYSAENHNGEWDGAGDYILLDTEATPYEEMPYETSGNFIHKEKDIVDDCYPTNNAYKLNSANHSPAHYWYVKGKLYIYDQKVSAYTGSANAYSKEVHLPLTITAASHGKLQLLNVKPNLYAYKMPGATENSDPVKIGSMKDENGKLIDKVTVNNENDSYELNDVITWWDWSQLPYKERQYFVPETYVNCVNVTINEKPYESGAYVMDDADYNTFKADFADNKVTVKNAKGEAVTDLATVFRLSNNIGHDAGYVLTLDMNSPSVWDDYYTATNDKTDKISKAAYDALMDAATDESAIQAIRDAWREGPTFTPKTTAVYGKKHYTKGDVVTKATYDNAAEGKNNMVRAYVAKESVTYDYGGMTKTVNAGTAISVTEFNGIGSAQNSFAEALICTATLKLAEDAYLLYGQLYYAGQLADLKKLYTNEGKNGKDPTDVDKALTDAYICTVDGDYGGQTLTAGTNYGAIQAWCSLPKNERITDGTDNFTFNYDAFDLLIDKDYLKVNLLENDSPAKERTAQAFHSPYTDEVDVEYKAVYNGDTTRDIHYENGTTKSFTKDTEGASIDNAEYETIRNDKRHYTKVDVKAGGEDVYFATSNFIYKGVPYGKGQIVDSDVYNANTDANNTKVEAVHFSGSETAASTVYYCYENYTNSDGYAKGSKISTDDYVSLTNDQQYFVIQGMEPTERTTLYVSSESDAKDVMSKRIYSVVYQYTYYENEDDGSIKMTNELHVINIHLELESGAPTIGPLSPPSTVLPGNAVGLSKPDVNPGLYEVLTNGWLLFTTYDDAVNYRNGIPFTNNETPVYWYQNEKNWIAFYSQTWLGLTYSNIVPLSVANYHDLDNVMKDKEHHMYVDRSDVDRDCKIYIDNRDCVSDPTKSKLDLLKDFFDLSVGKHLNDHEPLSNYVSGGTHLEFFLQSDVSPKKYSASGDGWTPISSGSDPCFSGKLHGDGHTVSGLKPATGTTGSLFGKLCGKVYNLGVTGSFTGSGVADSGEGHVENCWVKTSGSTGSNKAVFGGTDVINSYYDEDQYTSGNSGTTGMPAHAFYNGTVAYNLNGFYLNKRYYDHTTLDGSPVEYQYLDATATTDGTLPETMSKSKYPADYATYKPLINQVKEEQVIGPNMGYVESRFYDGDFRYASGSLSDVSELRTRSVTTVTGEGDEAEETTTIYYTPIWPDDYLFFGQALNYDHMDGENGRDERTHQDLPSHIKKSAERIMTTLEGNRIYRAPAYFGSSTMGVAYFNPHAVFAQTRKDDANTLAYKGMTAIDFTGGNGDVAGGYGAPTTLPSGSYSGTSTGFYPPLLDDGGLQSIYFADLTHNILAYTDGTASSAAATQTDATVSSYLLDEACEETDPTYRTIDFCDPHDIYGHWVQLTTDEDNKVYKAHRDHLLVDKQDFNCPISYTFATGKRMWYQREPDQYISTSKGWDVISLPFTAELVTTQDKGEITHFYEKSNTIDDKTKIGHEYWLREHRIGGSTTGDTFKAVFDFPDATGDKTKTVTNTYLWDHYYRHNNQLDRNKDTYQTFYQTQREYENYALLTNGMPYIIGFPGKKFYEFDLSGEWAAPNYPSNTSSPAPEPPGKQTITFASVPGTTIAVSDTEISNNSKEKSNYTFIPNYLVQDIDDGYLMNDNGDTFVKAETVTTVPFRPYFLKTGTSAPASKDVQYIIFDNDDSSFAIGDDDPSEGKVCEGSLLFSVRKRTISVTSSLRREADVRIVNVGGLTIASFTIQPGETIDTNIPVSGVYIVHAANGRYLKKLAIK